MSEAHNIFSGENVDWFSELSAGELFRTGEKEAESYVTGIACWELIVLGEFDKLWEVEERM